MSGVQQMPPQPTPADPPHTAPSTLLPHRAHDSARPRHGRRPIAVIGAGFSGLIATLQLLRRLPLDQPVLLCERSSEFAGGVAYTAVENEHLLNVRAANMSAIADEPAHFTDWLTRQGLGAGNVAAGVHQTAMGLFASRELYGRYLRSILDEAMRQTVGDAQLRLLPDQVVDVEPCKAPGNLDGFVLVARGGQRLEVAGIVIAVGNLAAEEMDDDRICRNPWSAKAWRALEPDRPILIVGTGLTMVDLAIGLRRRGFQGRIVAMSRGGLLSARHAPALPWPTPALTAAEKRSVRHLLARLRREVAAARLQGVDWRAVIDSLRPVTARLWGGLPDAERGRFLRHVRRYWDVHRHRMAPPHADRIARMQADGTLQVIAGRIRNIAQSQDCARVTYRPRAKPGVSPPRLETPQLETIDVQRVIMASGIEHLSRTRDRLMRRLLERGLVRPDAQGMGIEVTDDLRVVRADGTAARNVWALGPIVRGVFWECVAVPDIREQASSLADSVVEDLLQNEAEWSFAI